MIYSASNELIYKYIPSTDTLITAAKYVASTGFVIGAYKGLCNWYKWTGNRKTVTLPNSINYIEPIVNVSKDVGVFVMHIVGSGMLSAAIAVTAPISVPIMMCFDVSEKN